MKVFVLCDTHDIDGARLVLQNLRALQIPARGFTIGKRWRTEKRRLDELLSPATHMVVLYSEHNVNCAWLSFVAGYSIGTGRPLILYRPSRYPHQVPYLAPFFLVLSVEDLGAFLREEQKEWVSLAQRREARRSLLELGISFRGDAFAEAVVEGNTQAAELFLKAGLPADTRDKKGVPLLGLAVRTGNQAMVDLLLDAGAQIDTQSEDRGNSALMDAVAGGHERIARRLVEAGANVNLKSKDGQTALVLAVGRNSVELVELLLKAKADPDIPDKLGFSGRKYAKLFHNPEILALFEAHPPIQGS